MKFVEFFGVLIFQKHCSKKSSLTQEPAKKEKVVSLGYIKVDFSISFILIIIKIALSYQIGLRPCDT